MNLYLAGMIGTGKTTLGRRIAERLGRQCLDLDEEMERILGYSFHKLVHEKGWLPFRELEYLICKGFAQKTGAVVCLGGGTVRYQWNLDAIRGTGPVVLLDVAPEEIIRRVRFADRPRVNSGTTLEEDVHLMWERERDKYYAAADLVYRAEGKDVEQETEELLELVRSDVRFRGFAYGGGRNGE